MGGADGGFEARRGASGLRLHEIGTQHVGELEDQATDVGAEALRFLLLHRAPGVAHHVHRQRLAAVDHFAVDGERGTRALEGVLQGVVAARAELLRGAVPQRRQPAGGAGGHRRAELLLDAQQAVDDAGDVVVAGNRVGDAVDHRGERLHAGALGAFAAHEHQRVVVAQLRKVAVAREQCRTQVELVDRVEPGGGPLAGEVKGDVFLELRFDVHDRVRLLGRFTPPVRLRPAAIP